MLHALLISKLDAYGLTPEECQLICNYFYNRVQRTRVGVRRSPWAGITKGMPQGIALGHMLFNVFVNDLFCFALQCKLYNYADDNNLSKVGKHRERYIGFVSG